MSSSPDTATPSLEAYQRAFARFVRQPTAAHAPPGLAPDRLQIYRDLMFNNVSHIVEACFPIGRRCVTPRQWQTLQRRFFAQRRCTTPYFRELPQEFVDWLFDEQRPRLKTEPGYLPYLAHYEWLELAVDTHPDEPVPPVASPWHRQMDQPLLLEPSLRLACYPYPVHQIGPGQDDVPMQTTWLMVWRHPQDGVRFAEINQASYALLGLLQQQAQDCDALAQALSEQWGRAVKPEHVAALVDTLVPLAVIRGTAQP